MKTLHGSMLMYYISRVFFLIIILNLFTINVDGKGGVMTIIAGDTIAAFSGDNGPAKNARFNNPSGLCLDKSGNIFIADAFNNRIRRIDNLTGLITSIAGDGTFAYGGDGGLAANSKISIPEAVMADYIGNIYIADAGNNRIRKIIKSTGVITTIAGKGTPGNSGDGGIATNAELNGPSGICTDNVGNIYIADHDNNTIRKVSITTGIITTVAGCDSSGYSGDGGLATKAKLNGTAQVFADSKGDIFIADQWNGCIRKVTVSTGIITTIAGNGTRAYTGDNGLAVNAQLGQPSGLFITPKNDIYICDYQYGVIRKINGTTGIITTIAGTGIAGYNGNGTSPTAVQLRCADVFLDSLENIFIADYENNLIRKITSTVAVNNIPEVNNNFRIYPNPAKDFVIIANSNYSGIVDMELYDISGKRVMQESINIDHGGVKLPLNVPSGSYFLHLRTAHLDEHVERITITR